jgi:hypothetical protein
MRANLDGQLFYGRLHFRHEHQNLAQSISALRLHNLSWICAVTIV